MTESQMLALEMGGKGYTCAQIVLGGALRHLGRDNPDLIRAAAGLAQGGGGAGELCGALSGGLCLLGLHLGKGLDAELPDSDDALVYNTLVEWFRQTHGAGGKITCDAILGLGPGEACVMNQGLCGQIVASVLDYAVALLLERGLDPRAGREL